MNVSREATLSRFNARLTMWRHSSAWLGARPAARSLPRAASSIDRDASTPCTSKNPRRNSASIVFAVAHLQNGPAEGSERRLTGKLLTCVTSHHLQKENDSVLFEEITNRQQRSKRDRWRSNLSYPSAMGWYLCVPDVDNSFVTTATVTFYFVDTCLKRSE